MPLKKRDYGTIVDIIALGLEHHTLYDHTPYGIRSLTLLLLVNPLSPRDALKHHLNIFNFPTTRDFRTKISRKLVYQYMTNFFIF